MPVKLDKYQLDALDALKTGSILCGRVGSGKSITGIAYYFKCQGGKVDPYFDVMPGKPADLYIITTAKKRDDREWEGELIPFMLSTDPEHNYYKNKVVVDSWNNIKKYADVKNSFFIFDEQRLVGSGAWVKAFYKIARNNEWILLSATPGDKWEDYVPVFVANGYFKNKSEFMRDHVVYSPHVQFPKIDHYVHEGYLWRLRNEILVDMAYKNETSRIDINMIAPFDTEKYREIQKNWWDPDKNEPIVNAAALCYALRKVVNSDPARLAMVEETVKRRKKVIVFYNFDYELDILRGGNYGKSCDIAEWNGHKHDPIPRSEHWIYLVQYTAGAEGWNCITTDTMIFYSQNYSWKILEQASGRIDRRNTPFKDLYYYHIKSRSKIDIAIARAIEKKQIFNASAWAKKI